MKPEFGDYVEALTADKAFKGVLITRPEILGSDVIVLKLDNGYNIGISKDNIKELKVVKKYKKSLEKLPELKPKKGLPFVSIVSFGGTISSKVDYMTGGVHADYGAEELISFCPEIAGFANIRARKAMSIMSEDMVADDWKRMAEEIAKELRDCDGVVVTQGTDTLHFSTAAMSFMLQGLDKPVVFTASQRSIDRGSSDAFMNLSCAVNAAANFGCAEVLCCMHATSSDDYCFLLRGTKLRKMHTSRRDAFRPVNCLPVAKVFPDGRIEAISEFRKAERKNHVKVKNGFSEKVALHYAYPGMDPGVISYYIDRGYKGIVIAATALGHVNLNNKKKSLEAALKKAKEKGVVVVIASQTLYGRVNPYVYSNLRRLSIGLGCIFAEDMLPETAYIKLAWLLGNNFKDIKGMMLKNIAGEITERSSMDSFLY